MLTLENVNVSYGKIRVLYDISFTVNRGEIVSLIGSNGAGKTTLMRTISGLLNTSGKILFQGEDITKYAPYKRVLSGISQSPEGRGVFPGMTVRENLDMGAYARKDRKNIKDDFDRVYGLFPRLLERRDQLGGAMSGGEQQMLAIARAIMSRPKLLLLDEPSMGLAPQLIQQIFSIVREINRQGVTILMVEQNANQSLGISDHAMVLETGNITRTGTGKELLQDGSIRKAYLGV
ncbi:ABC transporter ATP-binding protein [Tropheryma whipplei]|uniref:Branched-chain amino acid ABC transporter ATP-binding protein n=1 Tax=Tropheryma whipplei (strain Twist) TaxID=203267 RepID=Q83FY4_TROWT|nr:ABC transporter ATP-binding protein [Tropheryma whipplei]AAO44654.1 branched-chain amino acid ABC transporter ATP-binding protein [Tropheryma whipplei str. Twist]MCO8189948.1 ABC transporter ATP-binding protein [Tropheryma whipplei]